MPEFITDSVSDEIAKGGTTVRSLNLLVIRRRDLDAAVHFYTAIGLRFQRSQMSHMMGVVVLSSWPKPWRQDRSSL